jgi:hypothetical protein
MLYYYLLKILDIDKIIFKNSKTIAKIYY